jgi:hypothetical protein
MTHKIFTKGIVTIMAFLLAACAKEPPKCSDEQTLALAKKAVLEQILKAEQNNILANILIAVTQDGLNNAMKNGLTDQEIQDNMTFELPRALAFAEKIKKYSCDATLIVGDTIKLPITYDSQLDDKGQHLVFVNRIAEADLFVLDSGLMQTINKNREAQNRTPPQSPASTGVKPNL